MRPRVDQAGRRLVMGDRAWSFDVDCRAGSVSLEMQGVTYRLRPLHWSEKRLLARFAVLGESFLQREFVRASLEEPQTVPVEPVELAGLFTLAAWFNSPDRAEVLPFDSAAVAGATFDLCQALRLPPEHFDNRDVAEVEMLWSIAQHRLRARRVAEQDDAGPEADGEEASGWNRILVLPDLPGNLEADPETHPDRAAAPLTERTERVQPTEAVAAPESASASVPSQPGDAASLRFRVTPLSAKRTGTVAPTAEPARLPSIVTEDAAPGAVTGPPPATPGVQAVQRGESSPATESAAATATPAAPALPTSRRSPAGNAPLGGFGDSRTLLLTLPQRPAPADPQLEPEPHEARAGEFSRPDPDALLDDFAELLAQSAAQLGIDVEP